MVRDQGALRSLPSKKHSCSELQKGHQHMLKVKKERESPEELDRKIKEYEDELKALKAAQTADSKAASAVASPDDETQPASPEEVEKARGRARKGKDTQKNAVAEPSEPKTRRTAAKAAPKAMSAPSGRSKSKSDDGSTPESAKKPGGKQPAQPPSKRLRSKSSGDPPAAPPRDPKIADLEKANAKLKKQLEALQKASSASTAKPSSQKRPRTPPSSAAASKKPTFSPQSEDEDGPEDFDIFGTPRYEPSDESGGENEIVGEGEEGEDDEGGENTKEGEGELSESAKNQRLRRICEVKPGTGVCRVPDEIHARWKKGGTERLKLRDELEAAGWDKDEFVNAIIRIKEKTSKFTRHKRRGWYTKEKMKVKLGWSKKYIERVVKYCERKGNEALVKKDKYDRSINKYHVEVDEDDDECSEDLEKELHETSKDTSKKVSFKSLDVNRTRKSMRPAEKDDGDSDTDKDAPEVNTGLQEYNSLKKFGDSLLSRNRKLSELDGQLDLALLECSDESPHRERIGKSRASIEKAMKILEEQFELVESTRAEVSDLKKGKLGKAEEKALVNKCEDRIKETTRACSKVTAVEASAKNVLKIVKKTD